MRGPKTARSGQYDGSVLCQRWAMRCSIPTPTFLGLPACSDLSSVQASFAILGVPICVPYGLTGFRSDAANAPQAVRRSSQRFAGHLLHFDVDLQGPWLNGSAARVVDCGDVPASMDVERNSVNATLAVASLLSRNVVPLIIGGDDSVPIACLQAYEQHGPVGVVQVDAHIDFRDEVDGVTRGYSSTMRRITEMPWVNRVVQVGCRGTGSARPSDWKDALSAGNVIVPAAEVHECGITAATRHIDSDMPWFITFDIDGLDASAAPGTSAPLPGGLSYYQAQALIGHVASNCRLLGMAITEYFPSLDVRQLTSLVISRLIFHAIGTAVRRLPSNGVNIDSPLV